MKIAVTGSRDCTDERGVWAHLDALHAKTPITRLAHGAAPGTDHLCASWGRRRHIEVVPYRVTAREWQQYGLAAGPIRNRRMLKTERPDRLVAFPGGRGTADCIRQAKALGIKVDTVQL